MQNTDGVFRALLRSNEITPRTRAVLMWTQVIDFELYSDGAHRDM